MRSADVRLGGLAVVAAGLAVAAALVLRWGRCVGDAVSVPCISAQSHTYDYLLPTPPWVPIPGAAPLEGVAHLLLAVAVALAARPLAAGPPARALAWAGTGALVLVGVLTLVSGLLGAPLAVNLPASLLWGLLGPVLLAALAVALLVGGARSPARAPVVALLAALALTMPWQEYALFLALSPSSYDTPPWAGSIRAVLLGVLGVVLAARSRAPRPVGVG